MMSNNYIKEIITHLIEAKRLAKAEIEKSIKDLEMDLEWDGKIDRTSGNYRKYKQEELLVSRLEKTIDTVIELANLEGSYRNRGFKK